MTVKIVNLALQGGGAHGAFAWGVLDKFLEDGRIDIESLCATSAGAMNAVACAYGKMIGGKEGARESLHNFWKNISDAGQIYSPIRRMPWEMIFGAWDMNHSLSFMAFEAMTRVLSPYQFNPFNINPLREVLERSIDFERLQKCAAVKLFISTTNVRTGQVRVFVNNEITLNVVLASACLPFLFQAVEIEGQHYWDGGYMGNPAIFPLLHAAKTPDVIIIHINPIEREDLPMEAPDIQDRVNEITFNSSLIKEMRSIDFVNRLLEEGWIKDEYKSRLNNLYIHSIRADKALRHLQTASKFDPNWEFLTHLRDLGRYEAENWLKLHYDKINRQSSVDLRTEFLHANAFISELHQKKPTRKKKE